MQFEIKTNQIPIKQVNKILSKLRSEIKLFFSNNYAQKAVKGCKASAYQSASKRLR